MKEPIYIWGDELTDSCRERLKEKGYSQTWATPDDFKERFMMLAFHLKIMLDKCNMGKHFDIEDENLIIILKQLIQTFCYLANSTSFEDGKFYDFDKRKVFENLGIKIK